MNAIIVAIDGPAGAGKSTVSRAVARELGYLLLDTGAIYRCVGLKAQAVIDDHDAVTSVAQEMAERGAIQFVAGKEEPRVLLDGDDVTGLIRTQEVGRLASRASAIPGVRQALLDMQRRAGHQGRVVVEGRDIGTVVFPEASAKFFLTASVEERARRRFAELNARGAPVEQQTIEHEVRERDARDSMRPVAPLAQAADAILIDSTELSLEDVVALIVSRVRELERRDGGEEA
jgi:cytidylate kinase